MNIKYILLSLAILLTACSSDNDEFNVTDAPTAHLTISTEIVTTRAFETGLKNDVEFKEGNEIGFWLFDMSGNDYCRYTNEISTWNRKATYRNANWNLEEILTLTDVPAKVVAYYPYQKTSSSNSGTRALAPNLLRLNHPIAYINIESYPHNDGQQDYLWGESVDSVDSRHPNVHIKFKHVLPRITFEVQKSNNNATDSIYIRSAILKNSADDGFTICTTGQLYENGRIDKFGVTGQRQSITNGYTTPVLLNKGETRTFDFLVLPTEVAEGSVILSIEARKGTTGVFQYYDISIPATQWEGGKQYTYPVTLNIENIQQQSSGTPGEKVYMGFNGDNGKPLYWSSWNLGASKVEDYGGLYGWGDPTGNHKEHYYDNSLYRDQYYMQDSVTCLSYYGGLKPKYTNISGTELDVVRAKWKSQWRIPTKNEFNKLVSNCTYEWTTYNQVFGFKFVSKINGNSIFLPYAPNRIGSVENYSEWNTVSGTFHQSSYYWTANVNENETYRATIFYFRNSGSCWIARGAKRYEGVPIRPVTE